MPVETKTAEVSAQDDALSLVGALWGGTKTMREAGEAYLPKESKEDKGDYDKRVARSTLTNFFKKQIKAMAGRVTESKIVVAGDDFAAEFSENVDAEGRNIHRFTYSLAKFTLRDGLRFILIDAKSSEGVENKADEIAAGIRPYWVEVDRRNVLGWKHDGYGFMQFRMIEKYTDNSDEFVSVTKEQIRVIEPNLVTIYRQDDKNKWALHEEISTSVDFVPVVPVYASQDDLLESEPPLMDLAYVNVEHWQKSSDCDNITHFVNVPFLHWAGYKAGYDEDGNKIDITLKANSVTKDEDHQSTIKWVEHSGNSIKAAKDDLQDVLDRAGKIGADFMIKKTGTVTATERALDEAGGNSELSAFSLNLQDSLNLALEYSMQMFGREYTGEVLMNTDFGITDTGLTVKALNEMYALGLIDRRTYWMLFNQQFGTEVDYETIILEMDTAEPSATRVDIEE